jgi:cytochrome c
MFRVRSVLGLGMVAVPVFVLGQRAHYGVGTPAGPEEIRARNISVAPDGTGLPAGHGTAAQGRTLFVAKCASCHGRRGQGSVDFPAVAGGLGTLGSQEPNLTVGSYWPYATTLWDYIHRAMPYQRPGSLNSDQVYSLTAYILFMNKIVREHEELNKESLPSIKMPNRNGFVPDPRPDVK